jgi:hypothetical protein
MGVQQTRAECIVGWGAPWMLCIRHALHILVRVADTNPEPDPVFSLNQSRRPLLYLAYHPRADIVSDHVLEDPLIRTLSFRSQLNSSINSLAVRQFNHSSRATCSPMKSAMALQIQCPRNPPGSGARNMINRLDLRRIMNSKLIQLSHVWDEPREDT